VRSVHGDEEKKGKLIASAVRLREEISSRPSHEYGTPNHTNGKVGFKRGPRVSPTGRLLQNKKKKRVWPPSTQHGTSEPRKKDNLSKMDKVKERRKSDRFLEPTRRK